MEREVFLINPPKHLPKGKSKAKSHKIGSLLGKEGSLHRPRVYMKGGHWQTSSLAKIARPGVKVNPFRENPGEELMLIGLNPFREVKKVKKHHKVHHNPFMFHTTKKHHKKHHRNPMGIDNSSIKMVSGAVVGGLVTAILPNFVNKFITGANTGMMGYIVKAAITAAGAYGADKIAGKDAAVGFVGGGLVAISGQAVNDFAPSLVTPAPVVTIAPVAAPAVSGFEQHRPLPGYKNLSGFENPRSLGRLPASTDATSKHGFRMYGNALARR